MDWWILAGSVSRAYPGTIPDAIDRLALQSARNTPRDGPVYAAGQCGARGPRYSGIWSLTCVVPTGFEPVSPP
jgi:hypothetical protein